MYSRNETRNETIFVYTCISYFSSATTSTTNIQILPYIYCRRLAQCYNCGVPTTIALVLFLVLHIVYALKRYLFFLFGLFKKLKLPQKFVATNRNCKFFSFLFRFQNKRKYIYFKWTQFWQVEWESRKKKQIFIINILGFTI